MPFIVAQITDAQLAKVDQANIPYVRLNDTLIPRFRSIVPEGMTAEAALEMLIKEAVRLYEHRTFQAAESRAADQRSQDKWVALTNELGLNNTTP